MLGSSFIFMKIAVQTVPTLWTVAFRLFIALAILCFYMKVKNLKFPRENVFWKYCFLLGITANIIPFSLITWAEKEINSNIAFMYMATIPIFSMILAHFLSNDEKISTRILIGMLISISGTVLLLKESIADMSTGFLSQIACIIAVFFFRFFKNTDEKDISYKSYNHKYWSFSLCSNYYISNSFTK